MNSLPGDRNLTAPAAQALHLSDLRPGQRARISGIRADLGASLVRLMEIGLIPGQTVQLIKFAPLGDPMELRVMNYNLVVRKKEASAIIVELL